MGAGLDRAVEVVDRLRSPGGCPWDRAQTHASLARYVLEESYEVVEAIETEDATLLREELGDLLLQVILHARIAQEDLSFDLDDVAADLADKMIRRHPHVFADGTASTPDEVNEAWEKLKASEKQRTSVTDGVPLGQPALALAAKLISRVQRAGLEVAQPSASGEIGARLFAVVGDAVAQGIDPEAALREVTRAYRDAVLYAEAGLPSAPPGER